MLSTETLVDLYRVEREHLSDPLFGGDQFPDFKSWRTVYETDYRANHRTVTTQEADQIMNTRVEQAEAELSNETKLPESVAEAPGAAVVVTLTPVPFVGGLVTADEETDTAEPKQPVAKAKAKSHRPARAKGPAKKKAKSKSAAPKKKAAVKTKTPKIKKSDIVRGIMADKANKKLERPQLLALIQKEAKLSKAAANTYMYQYR